MQNLFKLSVDNLVSVNEQFLNLINGINILPDMGLTKKFSDHYLIELKHNRNKAHLYTAFSTFWMAINKEANKNDPSEANVNNLLADFESDCEEVYLNFSESEGFQDHTNSRKLEDMTDSLSEQFHRVFVQTMFKQEKIYDAMSRLWDSIFKLDTPTEGGDLTEFIEVFGIFKERIRLIILNS